MAATWEDLFKAIELKFFQIAEEDWVDALNEKLEDLDEDYTTNHPGHVFVLNERLPLTPRLRDSDFDGSITVGDLALNVIEPRVQPLRIPASLRHVNFGDLEVQSVEEQG